MMICHWYALKILNINIHTYIPMKSQTRRQEATSLPPRTLKRKKPVYAESSSEDDTPLASSPMKSNGKPVVKQGSSGTDAQDDEDVPNKHPIPNGKPPRKKIKDDDDDDNKPIKPSAGRKRKARTESEPDEAPLQKISRRKKVKEEGSSSEPEVPKEKKRMTKGKTEETEGKSPTKAKGKKKKEEEEEEEEVFKWWENEADPNGDDGTVKWQTLEHNGVIFPPPYEPLPSNVKMKYKGTFLL